jgi:hypothetical protein
MFNDIVLKIQGYRIRQIRSEKKRISAVRYTIDKCCSRYRKPSDQSIGVVREMHASAGSLIF